jgi:hypothetical protein
MEKHFREIPPSKLSRFDLFWRIQKMDLVNLVSSALAIGFLLRQLHVL